MSLLPSFMNSEVESAINDKTSEIPIEYGIDFDTGKLTGKKVSGKEAIKVWIWNCLHTERFRYAIYSWDYGAELDQYIGDALTEEFINTDCEAEITEALLINPYINGISNFSISFEKTKLIISFTVNTTFGDLEVETSV